MFNGVIILVLVSSSFEVHSDFEGSMNVQYRGWGHCILIDHVATNSQNLGFSCGGPQMHNTDLNILKSRVSDGRSHLAKK